MAATSSSALMFHPGKGRTSYFCFPSNKNVVIYKHTVQGLKFCLDMEPEVAEEVLTRACRDASVLLEDGKSAGEMFREEAMAQNPPMTLLETLKDTFKLLEDHENRGRSAAPIESPEGLASILAKLAPNETPEQLAERLKELVDASLPEAIQHLKRCEDRNGRDDHGFVYIRKQKKLEGVA